MSIESGPTFKDPREKVAQELEEAKEKQEIAMKKRVPELGRYYKTMEVDGSIRMERKPALERMKLDIQAGLQTIKDALGVSDFAKAVKEVERLERRLKEMDK